MTEIQIVMPTGALSASANDDFLDTAMRVIGVGFAEPDEWASKYGTDYENDVFMMHRYCWCERDDCPWCAGCGAFEDTCRVCSSPEPHNATCYQTVVRAAPEKRQEALAKKLCAERGLDFSKIAWGWHCDCGAHERDSVRRDTEGCDYSIGRGIFAKFGKSGAPNFWFKPTNFQLQWYKYIGRSMKITSGDLPADFMRQVFATHPKGMTAEQALQEMARREEETAKSFAAMFAKLGVDLA